MHDELNETRYYYITRRSPLQSWHTNSHSEMNEIIGGPYLGKDELYFGALGLINCQSHTKIVEWAHTNYLSSSERREQFSIHDNHISSTIQISQSTNAEIQKEIKRKLGIQEESFSISIRDLSPKCEVTEFMPIRTFIFTATNSKIRVLLYDHHLKMCAGDICSVFGFNSDESERLMARFKQTNEDHIVSIWLDGKVEDFISGYLRHYLIVKINSRIRRRKQETLDVFKRRKELVGLFRYFLTYTNFYEAFK